MSDEKKYTEIGAEFLEQLVQQALVANEEDIAEINEHIESLKLAMGTSPLGLEQFAHPFTESIRTKGQARDRLLKLINMIANRVRTKEFMSKGQEDVNIIASPEATLQFIEKMRNKTKFEKDDEEENESI